MKHEAKQANVGSAPILKDGIKTLEDAAARRDVAAFGKAAEAMDWTGHPPEDFMRAMDLALEVGAPMTARRISERALSTIPNHATIQKYARIPAPPKVMRSDSPSDPGARANWRWFKEHGSEYRGRWVIVKDGDLLDSAESFEELVARQPVKRGVLLTRIP